MAVGDEDSGSRVLLMEGPPKNRLDDCQEAGDLSARRSPREVEEVELPRLRFARGGLVAADTESRRGSRAE